MWGISRCMIRRTRSRGADLGIVMDNPLGTKISRAGLPVIYYHDRVWFSQLASSSARMSHFGGPLGVSVEPHTAAPHLRRTLTLEPNIFGASHCPLVTLPLVFPQKLDGGKIDYVILGEDAIRIERISGTPRDDWPYENYPAVFPSVALDFLQPEQCKYEHFMRALPQDIHPKSRDKMIAVLPPTERKGTFGVGVWSPLGEPSHCVWSVFEVDLEAGHVRAYNMCD